MNSSGTVVASYEFSEYGQRIAPSVARVNYFFPWATIRSTELVVEYHWRTGGLQDWPWRYRVTPR